LILLFVTMKYYYRPISNTLRDVMPTTLTVKGQVTIPKQIRDALGLRPGMSVDFSVNRDGEVVIHPADRLAKTKEDRFESARGKAEVTWRTDQLMELLRGET